MNRCNLPESWRITGRDDVMDVCMKNENNPYCKDCRRYDYGKRHDVFFNYNDDKIKHTSWHPRNPKILNIRGSLKKYETGEAPRYYPETTQYIPDHRSYGYEHHVYDDSPAERERERERERDHGCEKSYPSRYNRKEGKKFKESELATVKAYLQNCLMQRLSVDWTEEDDLQLTNCIYMHLSKLKNPSQVCDLLDQISHGKKMDPILLSYISLLKKIYIKRGYFGESRFDSYPAPSSPPGNAMNYSSPEVSRYSGLHNYTSGGVEKCVSNLNYNSTGKAKYHSPYNSTIADNYNGSYTCNSAGTGKYAEPYNYDSGEKSKFNNSLNFNAIGRASSTPYKRAYVCSTCGNESCNCRRPCRYENTNQEINTSGYSSQGYDRNGKVESQKYMYTGDDRISQRGGEDQRSCYGRIRHEDNDSDIKLCIHPSRTLSYNEGLDSDEESTFRFHTNRHPSEFSIPRRRGAYYRR